MRIFSLLAVVASVVAASSAVGQPAATTPKRLVQLFDFEETNDRGVKLGRGLTMPPGWHPMGRDPQARDPNFGRLPLHDRLSRRPGFPGHNVVRYAARGDAASGEYSLHLGIDGGSSGAFLEVGRLPAVPGSDYRVTAKVRTAGLERSAARLRAYLVDAGGKRIEGSVRVSERLRSEKGWAEVALTLPGEFGKAAYLGIEAELVQPSPDPRNVLGNQQVVLSDVRGDAWFDDVTVWQLPHVQIATGSAVNITRGGRGPAWDVSVRDLVGGRLEARLTLYDHARRRVAQEVRPMGWGAPSRWRWEPDLPAYGWYLAELAVVERPGGRRTLARGGDTSREPGRALTLGQSTPRLTIGGAGEDPGQNQGLTTREAAALDDSTADPDRVIARTYNAALWLPPGTGPVGPDAERFALSAEGMGPRHLALLPELSRIAGLGAVIVSAWDRETTLGALDLRLDTLQSVIAPLKNGGRRVEVSFAPLPEELEHTRGVNSRRPVRAFAASPEVWMPYVQPILVRQGQRVNTWQLGGTDRPAAAYLPGLGGLAATAYEEFRHWTPAPVITLPWRLDQPVREDMPTGGVGYAVHWPAGVLPERLVDHLQGSGWATGDTPRRLHLRPASADAVPHPARVADLALRMVHAWEQDATGVALPDLWTPALERRDALLPDPLLGVMANVATRLAGQRAAGRLNLGDDRAAVIFRRHRPLTETAEAGGAGPPGPTQTTPGTPDTPGMLVAWNVNAGAARSELRMFLGRAPVLHDVWGNATPLQPDADGKHVVPLTDTPVFVTGVDPQLALFRAGFVLDEPFVLSTQTPHLRTLRLQNPWPVTISGRFTIVGPESWSIRPFRHAFSIGPGRSLELPIVLRFPVQEVAGDKRLTVDMEFTADRRYEVELAAPMRLGLEGVRLEASLAVEPGRAAGTTDAAVTCILTNTGDAPISLNLAAKLAGHPRRERLIPRLEPGQSVIRQFRFADAAAALRAGDIRLNVRETNGPAVLNKTVGLYDVE
ncbi:MAG: hypothetical protein AAF710_05345 [Planctomycetota bacterium]